MIKLGDAVSDWGVLILSNAKDTQLGCCCLFKTPPSKAPPYLHLFHLPPSSLSLLKKKKSNIILTTLKEVFGFVFTDHSRSIFEIS